VRASHPGPEPHHQRAPHRGRERSRLPAGAQRERGLPTPPAPVAVRRQDAARTAATWQAVRLRPALPQGRQVAGAERPSVRSRVGAVPSAAAVVRRRRSDGCPARADRW
jgi:hypothetical protein